MSLTLAHKFALLDLSRHAENEYRSCYTDRDLNHLKELGLVERHQEESNPRDLMVFWVITEEGELAAEDVQDELKGTGII